MRKLIIALAATAVGLAVHAAAINWNVTEVSASADNALTGVGQYVAYFFATSDSSGSLSTTTMDAVLAEVAKGRREILPHSLPTRRQTLTQTMRRISCQVAMGHLRRERQSLASC